ncbi:hypothetical protein PACILC2_50260 [Paenibacillus cisolokensis]|uniref:Phosphate transport regulator n=1 Tax=Paenibacillus cisolokensis TaxID=1658519 RepID=A0ABQ4NDZ3_9BACL|nr:DUF47 family protein [Paenibacillus cisolokensis]GIQ66458.1 hypothetical protein PACILC2_50260 [Paenibacillus cisolokensis]
MFFQTLENMAGTLVEAAEYFANNLDKLSDAATFSKDMKELESKCDAYTHTIYTELNKTFITPIEREDILALITSLDDVMDGIEASASRFEMYHIQEPDEYIRLFADNLVRSSHQIKKAIGLLTQKKLLAMREPCIALNELENQADDLLRVCIKTLFANVTDPLEVIKRKEIYERLEATTDCCEDVANTLESIIMRNS